MTISPFIKSNAVLLSLAVCPGFLLHGCASAPTSNPEPTDVPLPTPTHTPAPTNTPVPTATPGFTDDQAEQTAHRWIADNKPLVQAEIGQAIADHSDSLVDVSVDIKAQVMETGKKWEDGEINTEIVWTGARLFLPPGDDGRWELTLTSESVTDVEHQGTKGQLKAEVPFKIYGVFERLEGYEVLLDTVSIGLAGIALDIRLDQELLDKGDVDSALKGLLGN